MNLRQQLGLYDMKAYAAGTQATVPDSRSADAWIKKWLSDKQERLNNLRQDLLRVKGRDPEPIYKSDADQLEASWNVYKPSVKLEQHPQKVADGGEWAVTDPEGLIISTWPTKQEAERAAFALWKGVAPSSTGATAGARVKRVKDVLGDNSDDNPAQRYTDIFQDATYGDRTRSKFLKHPKPAAVRQADFLRTGDLRPSSRGGGAAGTGGAGGPSGGGGGSS